MTEHQSSRTLVKSAPELWAECSDAASLTRHLGAFGEIRITKLEPESAVAWEGAAASGTVRLEPSGWGTRVTLTVTEQEVVAEPEPAGAADPEPDVTAPPEVDAEPDVTAPPEATAEPEPPAPEVAPLALAAAVAETPRPGLFARFMLAFRRPLAAAEAEPEPLEPEAEAEAEAEGVPPEPGSEPGPELEPAAVEPAPDPEPAARTGEAALVAALDSLGMAHHRPYSRA
jgi:hypothetical protein